MGQAASPLILFQEGLFCFNGFLNPDVVEYDFVLVAAPVANEVAALGRFWVNKYNLCTFWICTDTRSMILVWFVL